jgi:hypothetical protein
MNPLPPRLAFFVLLFSGWVNRQQQEVIDYLLEENRVLRAAHGPRRPRLTDDQRRRLAVKGHDFATLIWPTLMPKFGPPATLTDPCRSQRDRGGLVGQESPSGVIRRDSA